ncbi:hypothetical protein PB2503_09094 [Parvularcula bermudensis HTCC2503]|uniref:Uncharacterized protein n=2 Tax=Parvularcula TaxID=208215 RepID=E0TCT3_PARBH|nr:hypothetical protein PB2503_09094 [Parvularcula bermudensis HTCC2503]
MTCNACAFFNEIGSECRRYAPQPVDAAKGEMKASWPTVAKSDWCGEFKQDEASGKKSA